MRLTCHPDGPLAPCSEHITMARRPSPDGRRSTDGQSRRDPGSIGEIGVRAAALDDSVLSYLETTKRWLAPPIETGEPGSVLKPLEVMV
jgi:hypothetical protein